MAISFNNIKIMEGYYEKKIGQFYCNSFAGRGSVAMITSGTTLYMWPVHATFITGYNGTDFLYSAHSNHRTNASLTLALQSDSNYSGVRFFMFTQEMGEFK